MKPVVVDASVAIKWLVSYRPEEADVDNAMLLFNQIQSLETSMIQPPHFIAEMMAVAARLELDYADRILLAVSNMEMRIIDRSDVYRSAIRLSIQFKHHLFDTLYHAVALQTSDALFITADEAYYRKAKEIGRIMLLKDYLG